MSTGRSQLRLQERYGVDSTGVGTPLARVRAVGAIDIDVAEGSQEAAAEFVLSGWFADGKTASVSVSADGGAAVDFDFDIEADNTNAGVVAEGLRALVNAHADFSAVRAGNRVLVYAAGEVAAIEITAASVADTTP